MGALGIAFDVGIGNQAAAVLIRGEAASDIYARSVALHFHELP